MIPFRPEISACDHCGECCKTPCLLSNWRDVKRLAKFEGISPVKMLSKLQLEKTPHGKFQVRIKPVNGNCPYHVDNKCQAQDFKPKGGKEFKCWEPATYQLTYFWAGKDLQKVIKL